MQEFISNFVNLFFTIYTVMVFLYVLSSWIPSLKESSFGDILGKFVEPVLSPLRKIIPPLGMIDISPIVLLIALNMARRGANAILAMIF